MSNNKTATLEELKAWAASTEGSKSGKIKALFNDGIEIKVIAKVIDVRYNFVYNVVSNYARMNGMQLETHRSAPKKDEIVRLLNEGKTLSEVSEITHSNYNQCWKIRKDLETANGVPSEVKAESKEEIKVEAPKEKKNHKNTQPAGPVKTSHIDPSPVTKEEKAKAVALSAVK